MAEFLYRVAKEFNVVTARISKTNEQRMRDLLSAGRCLGCENELVAGERVTRGLCATCYHGTLHAIKVGKTTEEDRLREGRILRASPGGRRPANKYLTDLMGMQANG